VTSVRARVLVSFVALGLLAAAAGPTAAAGDQRARPAWKDDLDALIGERPFSVAVGNDGDYWYQHLAGVRRPPASNQKLLLSMALLDRYPSTRPFRTEVTTGARVSDNGVIHGDLWLVGHGDPGIDRASLAALADALLGRGITRVTGDVVGRTGPYLRDWFAPGWKDYYPDSYLALPTALTFEGNETPRGRNIADPELRAATALLAKLEVRGIEVRGRADADRSPTGTRSLAEVSSAPLVDVLHPMNVFSSNFYAEVLGKFLGFDTIGVGSIDAGADRVCAWARNHGESFTCEDSSGLSYANRATAQGLVHLLWMAETRAWGDDLMMTLPKSGQGTLKGRLEAVDLRAKTGTLIGVSALSGWVWVETAEDWVPFSIMSSGYNAGAAKVLEDKIVRLLATEATPPGVLEVEGVA